MAGDRIGVQARAVGGYLRYLGLPYRKVTKIFKDIFDLNLTHPSLLALSSSPGEFHPQALTDPDVNVSAHPALIIQSLFLATSPYLLAPPIPG
jgi:hypothetical protein